MKELTYTELIDLTNQVLTCKAVHSHAWDDNPNYELNHYLARTSFAVLALRCARCGRERFDFLSKNGNRNGRPYYRNPVNYPKTHRLSGQELMSELMTRQLLVHSLNKSRRQNGK
jgi:hypothetical protein